MHIKKHKKKSSSHEFTKFFVSSFIASTCLLNAMPAHALSAVADTTNSFPGIGYGAQILDLVLKNWENPDKTATGTTSVVLRVAKDGRPFSCETRAFSSSKITDASICDAVAKIGKFPPHVGTQNTEVILTFVHESQVMPIPPAQNPTENTQKTSNPAEQTPTSNMQTLPSVGASLIQSTEPVQNLAPQTPTNIPTLTPDTAVSPSQAELQQNHNTSTQPILSSMNVSSLSASEQANDLAAENTLNQEYIATLAQEQTPLTEEEIKKSHELQRELTREEALAPPSDSLVLPEKAMEEYSQKVFTQARGLIRVPHDIEKGTYSTVARIDIEGNGTLQNVVVQKSSGNTAMDNAVLSVLKNDITYAPTPNRDHQSIWLTFTVKK